MRDRSQGGIHTATEPLVTVVTARREMKCYPASEMELSALGRVTTLSTIAFSIGSASLAFGFNLVLLPESASVGAATVSAVFFVAVCFYVLGVVTAVFRSSIIKEIKKGVIDDG